MTTSLLKGDACHGKRYPVLPTLQVQLNFMKKMVRSLVPVLACFLLGSCSTSKITSIWKAPETTTQDFNKILVMGIIREADRTLRVSMEDHLAGDLNTLGYNGQSAYQLFGPKEFENLSEPAVMQRLKNKGIDAVLTIVLLDKQKERLYVPGNIIFSPYGAYHDSFYGYYRSLNNRIMAEGYYQTMTRYFWESNLYDLKTNKLLYSVQTQSFEPVSTDALAHEYGQKIVQSMVNSKLLEKKQHVAARPM